MSPRTPVAASLSVLALLLSALLTGSTQSATSAAPSPTGASALDATSTTTRAASTPKVVLTLRKNPVTTAQRARVRVVVIPRASLSAVQAQSLRSGRVRVGVRGPGVRYHARARLDHRRAVIVLPKFPVGGHRVRATFLGTKVLEKARSRATTLRVVVPPADDGPGASGFPDETTTGVPAGTTLTPYTGSSTITTANTVIDGKTLGCIRVNAPGVVIRNSHISCGSGGVVVGSYDGDYSGTPLLLEDVEIDCQDGPGTAVGDALLTARRADIHGCENGFDMNQSITVEDSYIHDLWNGEGSHLDGIQLAGGHWNGSDYVCCALNITIRHNTIYGVGADGSLGTSAIISNPTGDQNILIENNLLAGGAVALYCAYEGTATNFRVVNNRFSRKFSPKVGAYGPSEGCRDETLSGNVYHESGSPVRLN